MKLSASNKRVAWLAAASLAVALVDRWLVPAEAGGDTVVAAVAKRRAAAADAGSSAREPSAGAGTTRDPRDPREGVDLDKLDRRQHLLSAEAVPASGAERPSGDAFAAVDWAAEAVASRPPVKPPPPPAPTVPAFPYAYMGALSDDGARTAFFVKGDRVLALHAGDVVDAVFRVDALSERQMTVTYLPLGTPIAVALGASP